ncbi:MULTISPECIES: molybdenum cofactor guanylyltransferase MobA [unclassified Thioalkalivibrio]|uniref:molybdenum cofactor guanylyltransferase MobA n=1 Tax=unclassified Thioalkalivibrio TaxID=2621013 RepID=UPI00039B920F|nr:MULTISPECIES: molybdenum cofactor guanylyltransferase MobA [unclassified Thioalkalivibrio]
MPEIPGANTSHPLLGLILAGGRGQRMGGRNKGWVKYRGRPLVEQVIERIQPQVDSIVISANTDIDRYRALGFPCRPDTRPDYPGPLAGIATAWAYYPGHSLLCVPVDAPSLPPDLAERLDQALGPGDAPAAIAHDGERLQPLFALLRPELATRLEADLGGGSLAVGRWFRDIGATVVDFSDQPDNFVNLNTPEDLDG